MARRILAALWAAVSLIGCLTAVTEAVEVSAAAAVLMDADSGRLLYDKNGEKRMLIASTTKLMTALVALEQGGLQQEITVTGGHMAEGSSMYLRPGEKLTLETLLYGLLLSSGNDAALAVTECMGGAVPFVARMNEKAAELGMENTHFANPNGLDDEAHYSTAEDMAKLAAAAMDDPVLRRVASTRTARIGGRTLTNHNKLLSRVEGCVGLKTGYTRAAGRTLVSCAERDGVRLVAVTLQDGDDWNDHASLYEQGFRVLRPVKAVERGLHLAAERAIRGG
ncbi:MAG: D-alanyl-D-alanine carboxypeptidase [Clostridiales bacterium]|nr:D-alanyl-D-alanine carboxypeptidase [Clostridiales bacterium]